MAKTGRPSALGYLVARDNDALMFAAHDVTIDAPYREVSGRLTHLLNRDGLHGVSEAAYKGALEFTLRVGPFGEVRGLSRLVRVRTLQPIRRDDRMAVALRWEATGSTGELFPVLDAELVLTPAGEERSRLELVGSYRPPLGRAGMVLDRVIMGRVAEATIRSLLEHTAAELQSPEPESQPQPGSARSWLPVATPEDI
jgi:hypothetical protein